MRGTPNKLDRSGESAAASYSFCVILLGGGRFCFVLSSCSYRTSWRVRVEPSSDEGAGGEVGWRGEVAV